MNKSWKVILAFVVVFVAGGAVGSVFTLRYAPKPEAAARQPRAPEQFGAQLMLRWVRINRLGLTPEQKRKIGPAITSIADETAEDLRRLRFENLHSEELILEHMQDEVAALLTPEQRIRFNDLISTQRLEMSKFIQEQQRLQMQQQRQRDAATP